MRVSESSNCIFLFFGVIHFKLISKLEASEHMAVLSRITDTVNISVIDKRGFNQIRKGNFEHLHSLMQVEMTQIPPTK